MTQPTQYTPTTDFSQQESINASGRSTVNTAALDTEFANIETTLDGLVSNIALIQRDDGRLADLTVETRCLSQDVLTLMGGFNLRGLWADATDYAVNDICSSGAYTYCCTVAHTSSGSIDATKWIQFGFTSGADAAQAASAAQASATNAAAAASSASTSATNAANSASNISGSVATAAGHAATATTKAGEAAASATAAAGSASAAASSAASITYPIAVSNGGTGALTAASARANLSAAASGSNADITSMSALQSCSINGVTRLDNIIGSSRSDNVQYSIGNVGQRQGSIVIREGSEKSHVPFFHTGKGYQWSFLTSAGWQVNTSGTFSHVFSGGNTYSLLFEASTGQLYVQRTAGAYAYSVDIVFA